MRFESASSEPSGEIVDESLVLGVEKHLARGAGLHHIAHVEEGGAVRDALCLLHVVGDDDAADAGVRDLADGLLHREGGDGVQGRAGLVEQDHVWLHGKRAGDAQALLLASGQGVGAAVELVLDLVPERGLPERLLHEGVGLVPAGHAAVAARRKQDVLADGLAEGRGLLEDHADGLAQLEEVLARVVDVVAVVEDGAADVAARDLSVHEVDAAQEGGLAAAGGADEGRAGAGVKAQARGVQRLVGVVVADGHVHGGEQVGVGRGLGGVVLSHLSLTRSSSSWPAPCPGDVRPR